MPDTLLGALASVISDVHQVPGHYLHEPRRVDTAPGPQGESTQERKK